jgi:hypothetical protein
VTWRAKFCIIRAIAKVGETTAENVSSEFVICYVVFLLLAGVSCLSCELATCAAIVHPLLKEPKYIIPSNEEEVDYICKYVRQTKRHGNTISAPTAPTAPTNEKVTPNFHETAQLCNLIHKYMHWATKQLTYMCNWYQR